MDLLREAGHQAPGPATWFLDAHLHDDLCTSVLVTCELIAGAELSTQASIERERVRQLCEVLQIAYPDERFAPVYGRLLASLTRVDAPSRRWIC